MSEPRPSNDYPGNKIEQSKLPAGHSVLQLMPLSHREFQARWSICQDTFSAGTRAAAQVPGELQLVLRAYSLTGDPNPTTYSESWHDYAIQQHEGSAFFTLPKPAATMNAAIGLLNQAGRFSPLIRGEAVRMPPLPEPPFQRACGGDISRAPQDESPGYDAIPGQANPVHHDGPAAAEEEDKTSPSAASGERPRIEQEHVTSCMELDAELHLTTKIKSGIKLRLGNRILEPDSQGRIIWRGQLSILPDGTVRLPELTREH